MAVIVVGVMIGFIAAYVNLRNSLADPITGCDVEC
jgi:hypothetical protein